MFLILFLFFTPSCSDSDDPEIFDDEEGIETPNDTDYGRPYKVEIKQVPESQTRIAFGLISDTHIDMGNCHFDKENTQRAREIIDDINIDCGDANCLGVIHTGDMVDYNNTQFVVAFRQLFENNYPGHDGGAIAGAGCIDDRSHDKYSKGSRIDFPVFPTLGNHDDPPYDSDDNNWRYAQHYLHDRIIGARHLLDHYKEVNYVWRWGQYAFFQLGKRADDYEHEDKNAIDHDKLHWLRNALKKHVGNSGMGVFIFQHYGWDTGSRWWTEKSKELELDVLCRRQNADDPCVPYNVLGIVTGHSHRAAHRSVHAGQGLNGKEVAFDNYILQASGAKGYDQYGFSVVHLDGHTMSVDKKNLVDQSWVSQSKDITVGVPDEPDSFRFSVGSALNSSGDPLDWSSHNRPFSGDTEFGGGAAHGEIDGAIHPNPTDIVLVGIDSRPGLKRFYYRIGFNGSIGGDRQFDSWSGIKFSPSIGSLTAGAGAALADIDDSGRPDLVLMYVDAPDGPDQFRYMIGWNLDADGDPERWSELIHGPSPGNKSAGGGAEIADIDGNGRPDLLVMALDDPKGPNEFRYTIAWNLDTNGTPERWGEVVHGPAPGNSTSGGGAAIDDIDGNGSLDLLLMSVDSPEGPNEYRYIIGWDLDANGRPGSWSDLHHGPSPGYESIGGGATLFYTGGGVHQNLFLMSLDDPLGW